MLLVVCQMMLVVPIKNKPILPIHVKAIFFLIIHQIKVIIMLKNNYFIKFILFSHSTFIFNFFLKSTFFSILFLFSLHQSNKKQNIIVLFIFLFSFRSKHTDFYLFLCIPTSLRIYDDIFDFSFLFSIG